MNRFSGKYFIPFKSNANWSLLTVWLLALILTVVALQDHKWTNNRVIIHDVTGYYSYLPALFIHNDLQFDYRKTLPKNEPSEGIWVNQEGDTTFLKMGVGLTYFYLPSFLVSHVVALNSDEYHPNGYSLPYQRGIAINTLLISILALFLARRLLLLFFSDWVTAISLAALVGGSNYLYYVSMAPGMSHPYGFLLVTIMLLLTFKLKANPDSLKLLLLGFIIGWMVSVRPTNAILALFPLVYLSIGRKNIWNQLILRRLWLFPAILVAAILPLIPQFFYWHYVSGKWIFYSYSGEHFFLNRPHLIDGLFGFRTGFFMYTPMMILSCFGLYFFQTDKWLKTAFVIPLMLFTYLIFSWWCWWYGGHSIRVLIETYPFLLLGFGGFFQWLLNKKIWIRIIPSVFVIWAIWINIRFTQLYDKGIIHWDSMTFGNYKAIFWNNEIPSNYDSMFKKPDYEEALREGER